MNGENDREIAPNRVSLKTIIKFLLQEFGNFSYSRWIRTNLSMITPTWKTVWDVKNIPKGKFSPSPGDPDRQPVQKKPSFWNIAWKLQAINCKWGTLWKLSFVPGILSVSLSIRRAIRTSTKNCISVSLDSSWIEYQTTNCCCRWRSLRPWILSRGYPIEQRGNSHIQPIADQDLGETKKTANNSKLRSDKSLRKWTVLPLRFERKPCT